MKKPTNRMVAGSDSTTGRECDDHDGEERHLAAEVHLLEAR